jgi:hypothetical protein
LVKKQQERLKKVSIKTTVRKETTEDKEGNL